MKTLIFLYLCIIPALLTGQTTLNSTSAIPGVLDTASYYLMDKPNTFSGPGAAGANQIWDFSSISKGNSTDIRFVAPRSGLRADPANTNLCEQNSGITGKRIQYKKTPNYLYIMGRQSGFTQVSYRTDSLLKFKFPVSYNDSHTSNYYYNVTGLGSNQRSGRYVVSVDGWGKIKLPYGDVDNVLRVKIDEAFEDTLRGTTSTYSSVSYEYWHNKTGSYIMSVKYENDDGMLDTIVMYRMQNQIGTAKEPNSIVESQHNSTLQLFPNPASNEIKVVANGVAIDTKVHITNLIGSVHKEFEFKNGRFDVSAFSSGVYFLFIEGEESQSIRFVVEN